MKSSNFLIGLASVVAAGVCLGHIINGRLVIVFSILFCVNVAFAIINLSKAQRH